MLDTKKMLAAKLTPKQWMAQVDAEVLTLAASLSPLHVKFVKAVMLDNAQLEEALTILEPEISLKDKVYFMSEDYEGEGIVYRIDGETLKVFAPATQKMYTVDLGLVQKI